MEKANKRIKYLLKKILKKRKNIKINFFMNIIMEKGDETNNFPISTQLIELLHESEINEVVQKHCEQLERRIENYTFRGSGWRILRIDYHAMGVNNYRPLRGSGYIKLPDEINNKKATINIKNTDDKCFIYCLGRRFDSNPENDHLERVSKHLKHVCKDLGFDQINTPVKHSDFPKIEQQFNISINVYDKDAKSIIYKTKKVINYDRHIDLLFVEEEEKCHYVWVKNFNKLMNTQTKNERRKYFCRNCLAHFMSEAKLNDHTPRCLTVNTGQTDELPEKSSPNSVVNFKAINRTIPVPFVIYADCEAISKKLPSENLSDNKTGTVKTHEQECCSYGYKVVCLYDSKYSKPYKMFRGENAAYKFLEAIFKEQKVIQKQIKVFNNSKPKLTKEEEKMWKYAKYCYVCKKDFASMDPKLNWKVRDHCHITEKYRGPACNSCNLKMKLSHKVPVIFHNLKGYDSHFMIQEIGKFKDKYIDVIADNMEKYKSFSIGRVYSGKDGKKRQTQNNLIFIDSFQFMSSSIEELV